MEIQFISINTLINIPSVRFIVDFLIKKYNTYVTITERSIDNQNNYFENNPDVRFNYVDKSKAESEYRNQSFFQKIKKYLFLIAVSRKSIFSRKKSILICPDFQVLALLIFFQKICRRKKAQLIYLQFELVEKSGSFNRLLYNYILKNAFFIDLAIFPEINRQKHFTNKCTKEPKETFILPNTCLPVDSRNSVRHKLLSKIPENAFIIGHVGNVGDKNHYIDNYLKVAEKLTDKNIYFVFLGRQNKALLNELKKLRNPKILFLDKVPHQELKNIYPFFDLGIILYRGISPNYEFAAPNKLYEFWAYGIPVIAHGLDGLILVFKNDVLGKLTNMDNLESFKNDIVSFAENQTVKTQEIKRFFDDNFSISIYLNELEKKLDLIVLNK